MKSSRGILSLLALQSLEVTGIKINPFKDALQHPIGDLKAPRKHSNLVSTLDILDSKKSEIYMQATLELKRLEEEPMCHRMAVQLLLNDCKGLEDIDTQNYASRSAQIQRHVVESFTASLAICDLEYAGFTDIPRACSPFRSHALHQAVKENGNLRVSIEQIDRCTNGLGQDSKHWATWLSYRDKALLYCRAARVDIEKDHAILHHKKLIQVMEQFADGLAQDLEAMKGKMAQRTQETETYFEGVKAHIDHLNRKVQNSAEMVVRDFKSVFSTVKESMGSAQDLQQMLASLRQTMLTSNAELVYEHDRSLALSTTIAQDQMDGLSQLAVKTATTVSRMNEMIESLVPAMQSLHERQNGLEKRSSNVLKTMEHIDSLLQNHTGNLEQATFAAIDIQLNLERAALDAESWNHGSTLVRSQMGEWFLRLGTPVLAPLVVGYGLPPSLRQNIALVTGGYAIAETWIQMSHCDWSWIDNFHHTAYEASPAKSMTQLPKNVLPAFDNETALPVSEDAFDQAFEDDESTISKSRRS